MNKYEMMFIVKATMESENVKATAESIKKLVTDLKGNVVEYKELGEKKLAYPIKKELNGYYFLMQFEATKELEAELNRKAGLDENVLRHLIIKLDEE
jgi:small subunit ribosomal protein S6